MVEKRLQFWRDKNRWLRFQGQVCHGIQDDEHEPVYMFYSRPCPVCGFGGVIGIVAALAKLSEHEIS